MNGVLVVDKPAGRTSHDVVALARRALGEKRIGHTGTLDPLATGVLPLVVGRATRLARFFSSAEKEYMASVRFGMSSRTFDSEGVTVSPTEPPAPGSMLPIDLASVEAQLEGFRGTYAQTPPPFSAKKVDGVPAYRRARANQPVELKPVTVTVTVLQLLSYDAGVARLRILCSSGFYVRTLAHELGERLGCGAFLENLRRVRAGEFTLNDAVTIEALEAEGPATRMIDLDRLLPLLPPAVLNENGLRRAAHGNVLSPGDFALPGGAGARTQSTSESFRVRLVDDAGHLLGIGEARAGGLLHPAVVLV
jgi:tRNA pseudouridine55 synthase